MWKLCGIYTYDTTVKEGLYKFSHDTTHCDDKKENSAPLHSTLPGNLT